jgi:hypothetical protein
MDAPGDVVIDPDIVSSQALALGLKAIQQFLFQMKPDVRQGLYQSVTHGKYLNSLLALLPRIR